MPTLKVTVLVACLADLCAPLHSPSVNGVDIAARTANSSNILSHRIRAEEVATTDLMASAKANVDNRADAVRQATTEEGRKLAKEALEEAKQLFRKIEAASSAMQNVEAVAASPNASVFPSEDNTLTLIISPIFGGSPSAPNATPSPIEEQKGNADDVVAERKDAFEGASTAKPKEMSFPSTATTEGATTGTTTTTKTETMSTTGTAAPAGSAAKTLRLSAPREPDEPGVLRIKEATTESLTKTEPTKENTKRRETCATKDQKNEQQAQQGTTSAKKPTNKANAAKARAQSVIQSATIAEDAAKGAMELAQGDAEKQAARAAMQSAKVLILRGRLMLRKAKDADNEIMKMRAKAGRSARKRDLVSTDVNEALGRDMIALTRHCMTVLEKVTLAVPSAEKGLIDARADLKTATQALGAKLKGTASGLADDFVEKVATKVSKALRNGLKALGSKNLDLQKQIEHLSKIAQAIESKAKKKEREGVVSKMHEDARDAREKSIAKDASNKATTAMKTVERVIKKTDVGVAALLKDLKKEPKEVVQKAQKRISKGSDMVVKAFGVKAQAARVKAAAKRISASKAKTNRIADARKLRGKAEKTVAKAKRLNEKEKVDAKKNVELAAKNEHALSDKTTALQGEVEAKVKEAKVGVPELEKIVHEDIDALKDEIKQTPSNEQREMAENDLHATKHEQAEAEAVKTKATKIDKAMSKATKGAELHVRQLEALKEKADTLDQRVEADRETASKQRDKHKKRLVDAVATVATKNIAKLKHEAGKAKRNATLAKKVGTSFIKTTPRSAVKMLGDVKKATSLELESSRRIEEAKSLAKEAMEAASDPAHAAEKFKQLARKAELAAQRARDNVHQAGRVKKRIDSEAKKVLKAGAKKLSDTEGK
eukprot:TRINITY_DN3682_c1_g1_i1.p1 TRINITY_DN3682_c1_g1~~TRINITY_DN3682_c1_g1_i1.p1  ORF type:complete len:913 (-),score=240.49 TRINITY_DN3682_c1_g1_i1:225-2891(-)